MVPRPWIHRVKRLALIALLWGCKAESVGVEVPRGGPEAIQMEDLRRDAFLLEGQKKGRAAGEARPSAGWAALSDRLRQMKTVPAFGRSFRAAADEAVVCSRKDGRTDGVVLVAVEDDPLQGARSTVGMAMLISLAKAWDTRRPPHRTILFCAWSGVAGWEAFSRSPPVPLDRVERAWLLGGPVRAGDRGWSAYALDVASTVDGLHFERLQETTRDLEAEVRQAVSASP